MKAENGKMKRHGQNLNRFNTKIDTALFFHVLHVFLFLKFLRVLCGKSFRYEVLT